MTETISAALQFFFLELSGGATWDVTFPLTAPAGEPANLSGWTVESEIEAVGAQNVNWTAAVVGSGVRLTLTAEATRAFTWEIATFKVLMTSGSTAAIPVAGTIRRFPL